MKTFAAVFALALVAGCRSSPTKEEPKKEEAKKGEPEKKPVSELEQTQAKLGAQKKDLLKIDTELASVETRLKEEEAKPASEERTRTIAELTNLQATLKKDREQIAQEVAALEAKEKSLQGGSDPDKALREMEEEVARDEEARRKKEEEAKKAEEAKRTEEPAKKTEGETAKVEEPAPEIFEVKWGPAILRIKAELARYKRW